MNMIDGMTNETVDTLMNNNKLDVERVLDGNVLARRDDQSICFVVVVDMCVQVNATICPM
jgi:hypothetical protein